MSRIMFLKYHRPLITCICQFTTPIINDIPVLILQHANEVSQSKGTLTLLANSLSQCKVIVGEDFSENKELNQLLAHYKEQAYRMFILSKNLQQLTKLQLPAGYHSHYIIRKTSVSNGLSTLEACCYALSLLEINELKYQLLIEKFKAFNQFILTFEKQY